MRDFFITTLEKLIAVIIVIMLIGVLLAGIGMMASPAGGFLQGLMVLVVGLLYVLLFGGMIYLFFGIYHNTKRTAELLEQSRS